MGEAKLEQAAQTTTIEQSSLLDQILDDGNIGIGRTTAQREASRRQIIALVEEAMRGTLQRSKELDARIKTRIGEIDELLTLQLNEILHHPEFQKLEASWRGLSYLVHQSETSTMLKIRVLNVTKSELARDLNNAVEFDQSTLYKKVYSEEYDTPGGTPYAALIGDYEFNHDPPDVGMLKKLSQVAAAAHAPFISAASPELFNLGSYTDLATPRDLAKIFDTDEFVEWRDFRDSEDSRYVGLCLPHVLMRLPYGPKTAPVEAFNFTEDVDGKDHKKYLWGNAAYAFATRLTDAFAKYSWCAAIRGMENGGVVEGLPTHTFRTDDGDIAMKCPTEIGITGSRDNELSKLGFIPLSHYKSKNYAVFFGAQSCQKPKQYYNDDATANARLSTQLQYMMAVCRIAHYIKAIMRDMVGSWASRADCERFLKDWISNYVSPDPNATQEVRSEYPLFAAEIIVKDDPARPGVYSAVALLRPHFQLDELTVSLRLVANLPQSS